MACASGCSGQCNFPPQITICFTVCEFVSIAYSIRERPSPTFVGFKCVTVYHVRKENRDTAKLLIRLVNRQFFDSVALNVQMNRFLVYLIDQMNGNQAVNRRDR